MTNGVTGENRQWGTVELYCRVRGGGGGGGGGGKKRRRVRKFFFLRTRIIAFAHADRWL